MSLPKYIEVLNYRTLPGGHEILLPSELDLAIRAMTEDELEKGLDRFEREKMPKELQAQADVLDKLEGLALQRAIKKLDTWEDKRINERRAMEVMLYRAQRDLDQLLAVEDTGNGKPDRVAIYRFQEFSRMLRIDTEDLDSVSSVNSETNERTLNALKRNLILFGKCLKGKLKADVDHQEVQNHPEKFLEKDEFWEQYGDAPAEEIKDKTVEILVDRMWAKNQMAPELAPYFRGGGGCPRQRRASRMEPHE